VLKQAPSVQSLTDLELERGGFNVLAEKIIGQTFENYGLEMINQE
jgi:hypothetical protein